MAFGELKKFRIEVYTDNWIGNCMAANMAVLAEQSKWCGTSVELSPYGTVIVQIPLLSLILLLQNALGFTMDVIIVANV